MQLMIRKLETFKVDISVKTMYFYTHYTLLLFEEAGILYTRHLHCSFPYFGDSK